MTRRIKKILSIAAASLVVLMVLAAIIGIRVTQTEWFRNYVKQKIVTATEEATGGKVDIDSFTFDWRHLRAVVTGFVIHGNEPPDALPFLRAPRVQVDLRLFTSIHHILDVVYLGVDRPEANILVTADGQNNIPAPKTTAGGSQPPLQSIVNAAIGHFDLNDATIAFAEAKTMFSLHANNFRAELWFNVLQQGYRGQLSFQPLYAASGRNTVALNVTLPITIEKNRVALDGATIATSQSNLRIDGSVENLRNPQLKLHASGQVALADLKNAANLPLTPSARDLPTLLNVDVEGTASNNAIQVSRLQLKIGQSTLQGIGALKDSQGKDVLQFKARLALGELGRLAGIEQNPEGTVALNGTATLDSANNYAVNGELIAKNVSFLQDRRRIGNVDLTSTLHFDPHTVNLNKLRISAYGGVLEGDASLQDFARYRFNGNLRSFALQSVANIGGQKQFPYTGMIQGPIAASGDVKLSNSLTAQIKLSITPGTNGIPVSGRLFASYDSAKADLQVDNSYVVLPHSRLNVSGSASQLLNVALSTTDLRDFTAAMPGTTPLPVMLQGNAAEFTGTVSGGLAAAHLAGHLRAGPFSVEGRMFDSVALDATASPNGLMIEQGDVTRGTMQAQFSGQIGMEDWKITPRDSVNIRSTIRNGDLADVLALAEQPVADTSGALEASVQVNGTVGNPSGSANITVTNGMLRGEPFDRIQAQANATDQLITISSAAADRGSSHLTLAAEFRHPRDKLDAGRLHAHVQGNQVDFSQIRTLQRVRPDTAGIFEITADVTADVDGTKFQPVDGTAVASVRGLQFDRQNYGDSTVNARTSGQTVQYQLTSTFAGSNIRVTGDTQLQNDYKTSLDASISNLPIERVLAAAQRTDIPAKGRLTGTVHFSGTKDSPEGNADLNLTNAVLYDEPVDRLHAKASYEPQRVAIEQLEIAAADSQLGLTAQFDHPKDNLQAGNIQFHVNNSHMDLARIHSLQIRRPGLGGAVQLSADGTAELHAPGYRVSLQTLKANVAAKSLTTQGKNLGDATLTADTQNNKITFDLTSNLAGASIQGRGSAQPGGDYPVDAQLTFSKLEWANLAPLIETQNVSKPIFDLGVDGDISVHGPAMQPEALSGSIHLNRFELTASAGAPAANAHLSIKNDGPIAATLNAGTVRIDSAHLTGAQSDIRAKGSISIKDQSMNLTLDANADLGVLQALDRDISSSGKVVVATSVRGTVSKPLINGTLQLKNASVTYTQFPNGISNANGTVEFNDSSASLRNLTAETGGGKLTLTGFAFLAANPRFELRANASGVRVDIQQGVSVVSDGTLNLAGNKDASTLSGRLTITRVNYAPRSDLGSILARATPPTQSSTSVPLLDNMKLQVQVQTSDALQVRSAMAQSLEGTASLRVQGTASHPSVLGRVNMTAGKLTFFGNSYTVNSGIISFYNPIRVEPILDVSLETNTEGVDVTLRVTGPIDNLKLSYTSDPPLQFEEIVGLLAAGTTPTSDPTLLANNPPVQQGFTQMGESAVMGQALANPVANRLQRVFGITQLKINPAFTNGSSTPQTTLTVQQQVTTNVTFTYITQVDNANAETVRVEITLNPQWSAAAMRDEFGIFSVNFYYKRQFH
jgi:translocation and assembly module TamB